MCGYFFPALRIVFKSGQKGGMHSTVKLRKRNQDHDRKTCKVHATGHLKMFTVIAKLETPNIQGMAGIKRENKF